MVHGLRGRCALQEARARHAHRGLRARSAVLALAAAEGRSFDRRGRVEAPRALGARSSAAAASAAAGGARGAEATPEPKPVEERVVEPKPDVKPPTPEPTTDRHARNRRASARRVAGLLPLTNQLQALRNNGPNDRLQRTETVGAATSDAPLAERSLITSRVGHRERRNQHGGALRNTGGSGSSGRATTQVESPVEGFAEAGGAAQRTGASDKVRAAARRSSACSTRTRAASITLYNRALRENPALQGKVVLRLTIAADGRVTFCEVVSSELNDPELERGLVQRVLQFQFEARDDVEAITTTKPIDFFPA